MKNAARRGNAAPAQGARDGCPPADDPHDAIDLELLALWLGISRLRESLRMSRGRRRRAVAMTPDKAPALKKLRRKAA